MSGAATAGPAAGLRRWLTVASAILGTVVYVVTLFGQETLTIPACFPLCLLRVHPREGGLRAVGVDQLSPLDQGIDHLVLRNHRRVAPPNEQVAPSPSGSDPEVGVPSLARAVDNTAHDSHLEGDLTVSKGHHGLLGNSHHVNLGPPAARTGDQINVTALP